MKIQGFSKTLTLNTGAKIPTVGLGTLCAKEGLREVIRSAVLECGYRHIDTARDYGNEDIVGATIEEMVKAKQIRREDLFVTTKIFNHEKGKGKIAETLRDSLKNLRMSYVDLLLIHWPIGACDKATKTIQQTPLYQTWAEFEECYEQGLCKAIGVSNFGVQLLLDLFTYCKHRPAVNQIELHPYLAQTDLVEFCRSQGIVVEAYSPLGSPGTAGWRPELPAVLENPVVKELAKKYSRTPAQVMLNWGMSRGYVILPKTEKKERLKENMAAGEFAMEKGDYEKLSGLNIGLRYFDAKYWDGTLHIPIFA